MRHHSWAEPYKIKAVELLKMTTREQREAAIREAGTADPKFDHEIEILRTLVKDNPSDTNARIALSEAVNDGFDDAGEPRKGKKESLDLLQGVLKEESQNSAANHLWIHAVEAGPHPEQALHSAEILGSLAPASGHMVHMPSHIDVRRGRWEEAIVANTKAVEADRAYREKALEDPDFYRLYMSHNHHMKAYAAMMVGRSEMAMNSSE